MRVHFLQLRIGMEKCLRCGRDVSTAKERKQRRLLGSSTAEKIRNTLTSFFQWYGLQVDAETLRRGYICRNCVTLREKCNILHEEVATNVRSEIRHLSVAAGGTTMKVLNPSCQAPGSSAEAVNPNPVSTRTTVPQDLRFAPISSMPVLHALLQPLRMSSPSSFATSAYTPPSSSPSSSMSVTATSKLYFLQCWLDE